MFIKGGRLLFYDYNYLDGVHYTLVSNELPAGTTDVKFNFIKDPAVWWKGRACTCQWQKSQAEVRNAYRCISAPIRWRRHFDVGRDTGTQVTKTLQGSLSV